MEVAVKPKRNFRPRLEMPKRCKDCLTVKPSVEFYSCKTNGDGLHSRCITCFKIKDSSPAYRYARSRYMALKYNEAWDITLEEYEDLIRRPCDYCGWKLEGHGRGLDRMDNSKGYIPGNCTPACGLCNSMKGNSLSYLEQKLIMGPAVRALRLARESAGLPQPDRMVMPKSPLGQGHKKALKRLEAKDGTQE